MAEVNTTQSFDVNNIPWDKLSREEAEAIKKLASEKAKELASPYMDSVKVSNYTHSVEKAITRLLQIYRLFYEGDETGKGAPEEKKEWLIKQCDRLSSASIAEEAKEVEKVNRLRQGGGGRPRRQPKETDA